MYDVIKMITYLIAIYIGINILGFLGLLLAIPAAIVFLIIDFIKNTKEKYI